MHNVGHKPEVLRRTRSMPQRFIVALKHIFLKPSHNSADPNARGALHMILQCLISHVLLWTIGHE